MKNWKRSLVALSAAMSFCFSGCAAEPLVSGPHEPARLSAWIAEWDAPAGIEEYRHLHRRLDSVSCFAVSFDSDDRPVISDELKEIRKKIEGRKTFLTIVNDWQGNDGKGVEKDTKLLKRLLADDGAIERHVASLVKVARDMKCDGLELDYEGFWKDESLVAPYMTLTYRLSRACIKAGLELRIVLEPSADFSAGFAKGPTYVVMFYNLYGKHSGPDPKADGPFIEKTVKKMEPLPGDKAAAFATGGCLWENPGWFDGKAGATRFISEAKAEELRRKQNATAQRDASGVLYFDYEEKGRHYVVWYSDSETINAWITKAAAEGLRDISLWRLGGNTDIGGVTP